MDIFPEIDEMDSVHSESSDIWSDAGWIYSLNRLCALRVILKLEWGWLGLLSEQLYALVKFDINETRMWSISYCFKCFILFLLSFWKVILLTVCKPIIILMMK